ncbi:MAG: hypothetical protein N2746_09350 [Deltaproteobacteria bacterium]|nr:hypothetical protein [Deltaproteobacteria bacterium]
MKKFIAICVVVIGVFSCINAELKEGKEEDKYVLKLIPESKDLIISAIPGETIKFTLKVDGLAPLRNMVFIAGKRFFDIAGVQNRTPPYQVEITNFTVDKDSNEESIFCKVIAETNEGLFVVSNVVIVRILDMSPPQIIKFEKDQSPSDIIYSDSTFSILVEAQDLNSGISKIELMDLSNYITTKISEKVDEKYVSRRYRLVAPKRNCGVVQLLLRVYDGSLQVNFVEKRLLLKINGHPFDENAPVLTFISPAYGSFVSINEKIDVKLKAEDDCSLVDKVYYYFSYNEQVNVIDVVNKKRVVEEEFSFIVPDKLKNGESFSIYAWAEDTNNPKHGSIENAVELRLFASVTDVPKVVIISPQDNASFSIGDKISIYGTATSGRYQIKEITLRISGAHSEERKISIAPPQPLVSFNFDFIIPSNLKAGDQLIIYVEATDNSESETKGTSSPVRVNVVNPRPVVKILSPSNGDVFYPLSIINMTIFSQSSNLSIKSISYHIEGIEGVDVEETYELPIPQRSITKDFSYKLFSEIAEGTLSIVATAVDTANNEGKSDTIQVKVIDNVKPIVNVISPVYNSYVDPGSTLELTVKVEDKNSFVSEVNANIISPYNDFKKLLINKKSDEVIFSFNIPDSLVSNQVITIQVYAVDDSSLSNKSEVVQWRLRVR